MISREETMTKQEVKAKLVKPNSGYIPYNNGIVKANRTASRLISEVFNYFQKRSCKQCVYSDENLWCSYFANGTTVQPDFYCKAFTPKDNQ